MDDLKPRCDPDWQRHLHDVLARLTVAGAAGVVVFDLDSTLLDNRPRQARIFREYGAAHGVSALTRTQPWHFGSDGWDLTGAAIAAGVAPEEAKASAKALKAFWSRRFFTSAYCADDVETVGAPRFVAACRATGAHVLYVTGRHEGMRQGTVECLTRIGFPLPGTPGVELWMKPNEAAHDDDYKRTTHEALSARGTVVAAFDNEPTHANDYARRFPQARVVHLATDHSGRPVTLEPCVVSVPHFAW
jgi:hypothetical protein